jgi:hypothetical protein
MANATLDYAEKTFPYPFQTKTEQVVVSIASSQHASVLGLPSY